MQLCLRSLILGLHVQHRRLWLHLREPLSTQPPVRRCKPWRGDVARGGFASQFGRGTEILPALQFVLEQPCLEGRIRQVVVLTDGQVTNTDAVLALVSKHAAHNRVFALGIGAGASQHLVNGIARAGGGSTEFIHPGERIEPKVVRLLGRLLSPALTDVAVSWGGLDARQAPTQYSTCFCRWAPAGLRVLQRSLEEPVAGSRRVVGGHTLRFGALRCAPRSIPHRRRQDLSPRSRRAHGSGSSKRVLSGRRPAALVSRIARRPA